MKSLDEIIIDMIDGIFAGVPNASKDFERELAQLSKQDTKSENQQDLKSEIEQRVKQAQSAVNYKVGAPQGELRKKTGFRKQRPNRMTKLHISGPPNNNNKVK